MKDVISVCEPKVIAQKTGCGDDIAKVSVVGKV